MDSVRIDGSPARGVSPLSFVSETPVELNQALSEYAGVQLYVKREDQQDSIGSGVKLRQITNLLHHVTGTGNSPIIIDGVPQSNCVMSLCHYARMFDIPVHVILKCNPTDDMSGNLGRIRRTASRIAWAPDRNRVNEAVSEIAKGYVAGGSTPTIVPAGANCNAAVRGPIGLGVEISRQEKSLGLNFSHVVLGVASGGTYAGLQLSVLKHQGRWAVKAVRTDDYDDDHYQRTYAEKRAFLNISCEDAARLPSKLELFDGAALGGYGEYTDEDIEEVFRVEASSGIFFSPTYSYKALLGTKRMVEQGILPTDARVLLINTGGINEREIISVGRTPSGCQAAPGPRAR